MDMHPVAPVEHTKATFDDAAPFWWYFYRDPEHRRRIDIFYRAICACAGEQTRWLDAGCGAGIFIEYMHNHNLQVCGVDISPKMIEAAQRRTHLPIVTGPDDASRHLASLFAGNLEHLPYPTESFDGIYSCSVLEYVPDIRTVLYELNRICKYNGHLIFSIPNQDNLALRLARLKTRGTRTAAVANDGLYRNELTRKQLIVMLRDTKWTVRSIGYFGAWQGGTLPLGLEHRRLLGMYLLVRAQKICAS